MQRYCCIELGYCIETVVKILGFDIKWTQPADDRWGVVEKNGSWNGIIGDLERQADRRSSTSKTYRVPHTVV